MAKSRKRQLKALEDKRNLKVTAHLEMLGAAYCKASKIEPHQACLHVEKSKDGKGLDYWFDHFTDRINMQEAHPDVQAIFGLAMAIQAARRDKDPVLLEEALVELDNVMKRYEDTDGKTAP